MPPGDSITCSVEILLSLSPPSRNHETGDRDSGRQPVNGSGLKSDGGNVDLTWPPVAGGRQIWRGGLVGKTTRSRSNSGAPVTAERS